MTEPAIAAGPEAVVGVFFSGTGSERVAWYANYNRLQGTWSSDLLPGSAYTQFFDLSVAYDPVSPGFLVVAEAAGGGNQHIVTNRLDYDPQTGGVMPRGWVTRYQAPLSQLVDKPYLARGDSTGPEYYIFWSEGALYYKYLWSGDGGQTWLSDYVYLLGDPLQRVIGSSSSFPAVHEQGPVYLAYLQSAGSYAGTIRIVRGLDGDAKIWFEPLYELPPDTDFGVPVPLGLPVYRRAFGCVGSECWLPGEFDAKSVPQIAVDPTDPTRLYVVYHDLATAFSHDVNVYVRVLHKNGAVWDVAPRIRINDDDTFYESDQFMPSISVDELGRAHVIFYDDRKYNVTSDQPDGYPTPKFDAYYAYSQDHGEHWANLELWRSSTEFETALDFTLQVPDLDPREYIGIASLGDEVWTIYTGTSVDDPQYNQAVMSSNLVNWNPP